MDDIDCMFGCGAKISLLQERLDTQKEQREILLTALRHYAEGKHVGPDGISLEDGTLAQDAINAVTW